MKTRIIAAVQSVIFFLSSAVWADDRQVCIKSATANEEEFLAFLDAHSSCHSFADYYDLAYPDIKAQENLLEKYERAQTFLFKQQTEKATQAFIQAADLALTYDWPLTPRKIIFASFIRLSELARTEKESHAWLTRALMYDAETDLNLPWLKARTRELLQQIRNELSKKTLQWPLEELKHDFKYIKINGHKYNTATVDEIRVFPGAKRITLLSDVYAPVSLIVQADQLTTIALTRLPLVKGNCSAPEPTQVPSEITDKALFFFSPLCVKGIVESVFNPLAEGNEAQFNQLPVQTNQTQSPHQQSKFIKWLIIGIPAVAAGILLSSNFTPRKRVIKVPADDQRE